MADSIFDVSRETFNAATFWINYVTCPINFPVDGMLVTTHLYCNSCIKLSINFDEYNLVKIK